MDFEGWMMLLGLLVSILAGAAVWYCEEREVERDEAERIRRLFG